MDAGLVLSISHPSLSISAPSRPCLLQCNGGCSRMNLPSHQLALALHCGHQKVERKRIRRTKRRDAWLGQDCGTFPKRMFSRRTDTPLSFPHRNTGKHIVVLVIWTTWSFVSVSICKINCKLSKIKEQKLNWTDLIRVSLLLYDVVWINVTKKMHSIRQFTNKQPDPNLRIC